MLKQDFVKQGIEADVQEISVPLYPPRIIFIDGINKDGQKVTRILNITNKGKMSLT